MLLDSGSGLRRCLVVVSRQLEMDVIEIRLPLIGRGIIGNEGFRELRKGFLVLVAL